MKIFANAISLFLALTILTGGIYPLAVTLLGQLLFNNKANGSIIIENGRIVASELIGQPFSSPQYFWSRPSATSSFPYNSSASSGSNLAPSNPLLREMVSERINKLRQESATPIDLFPADLVTASGSGLDPHISKAAALVQLARVSRARGVAPNALKALVDDHTEPRFLGVLGEPRINVYLLNRALDEMLKNKN